MGFFVRFLFCLALLTTGVLIAPDAGSQAYVCNPACSAGGNEGRTQAFGGAGLEYPVWRKLAARLEYEYYGKATRDDPFGFGNSGAVTASIWSLSLKHAF